MSDATTILVDSRLERDDAAAAATALYLRLVGDGTIEPHVHGLEPRFRVADEQLRHDAGILAIGLHASGHRWIDGAEGAHLVEGGPENGIFSRYDRGFTIRCPDCRAELSPGEEGSDALEEALAIWSDGSDSAFVACPSCANWTPLMQWRSPRHDFAVGHFAITLYGAHMLSLTGRDDHRATMLRHRLGDIAADYAVVFALA